MSESRTCRQCGATLTADAPVGLCRACLLKMGLEPHTLASTDAGLAGWQPPTAAELADKFPDFEILELLGRGGMGAVYKARQKSLDRPVALKILPPEVGQSGGFTERFAREAQALARLNHPHIVTVYDFGQRHDLYYFAMEFVDGPTLRQLIAAERIAPREALAIVPQICDALQFAHDHGIVHRDIKPENILLNRLGQVKIADFGLAKLIGAASSEGDADRVLGTPQYMAPEQMATPAAVDHRADVYSLGVVFYQMLTGELPGARLAPPSSKVSIDVRLDDVVLRALEQNPQRRYQQVSEVKTDVETIVRDGSERASPNSGGAPLKSERGYYATPEFWATPYGGFWRNQGTGELTLYRDRLVFAVGLDRVEIPLGNLRQLGLARGPRWTNPAGHPYLAIDYEDDRPRKLLFVPGGFRIALPGESRSRALDWLATIRDAVQAKTGTVLPGQLEPPEIIPSSPWGSVLVFAPLLAMSLLMLGGAGRYLFRGGAWRPEIATILLMPAGSMFLVGCWFVLLPIWSWYSRPRLAPGDPRAPATRHFLDDPHSPRRGRKLLLGFALLFALAVLPLWLVLATFNRQRPSAPPLAGSLARIGAEGLLENLDATPGQPDLLEAPTDEGGVVIFRGRLTRPAEFVLQIEGPGKPLEHRQAWVHKGYRVAIQPAQEAPGMRPLRVEGISMTITYAPPGKPPSTFVPATISLTGQFAGKLMLRDQAKFEQREGGWIFADVVRPDGAKLPVSLELRARRP